MTEIGMELLERYLAGQVSVEEEQRVEGWLAEDPGRWQELKALREALEARDLSDDAVQRAAAEVWARLAAEIGAGDLRSLDLKSRRTRPSRAFALPEARRRRLIVQAAAVVLLMIGGWFATKLLLRGAAAPGEQMRVAATAPGERATFRLPDGTGVMLGVASRLRYPRGFADTVREVSLEGEAYFDVAHAEGRAFVVRAGGMIARDLGTQFTVRAYPEDPEARVVVRQGRVAVGAARAPASERVVSPGQVGRVAEGRVIAVERADTSAYFAWIDGRLVLDGIPLGEALPELSRWFDLDFRLGDSALGKIPLTATLKTQPTAVVLENLSASLGARYRKQGRVVTLYPADQVR